MTIDLLANIFTDSKQIMPSVLDELGRGRAKIIDRIPYEEITIRSHHFKAIVSWA